MHPAYSVIVFTTASGAGYGLLIWLALAACFGLVPLDPLFGFTGFARSRCAAGEAATTGFVAELIFSTASLRCACSSAR